MMGLLAGPYAMLIRFGVLLAAVLSFYVFAHHEGAKSVQAKWDAEKVLQLQASLAAEQAAKAKGDQLVSQIQQDKQTIAELTREKHDAVNRLTHGTRCLDSSLVSVLNRTGPARLSGPPPVSLAEASSGFAADTDVGNWIADAQQRYHDCAAQLNALIDFSADSKIDKP